MTRATRQLCLVIVSVLLAGPAADGQTEPAPQQTSNLTTVLRNLWPLLAPSSTGNTEGGDPAQSRTNPKDAVPAVEPPSVGVASPGPETSLNPAVARGKIEALLGRHCVACHGPDCSVVPKFDVTRFDLLASKDTDFLVADPPERSRILTQVKAGRMPPAQRPPLAEQDKRDMASWINVALQKPPPPQLKGIVDTLRDDLGLTKLVELGEKVALTEELQEGGPYTILAPTNEALERLTAQGEVPDESIWSVLLRHGVTGAHSIEQLVKNGKVKSVGLQEHKVQRKEGVLFIGEAKVLQADVACKNGVIHVIDSLLWLPPRGRYVGRAGIPMVKIPAGVFQMGSPPTAMNALPDEKPQVRVQLSSFWMGETEVTRPQYREMMSEDPSTDKKWAPKVWLGAPPVQKVTWIEAAEFCNKVSIKEGLQPYYDIKEEDDKKIVTVPATAGNGYRLPTEAEWEYACRAGGAGEYCFGTPPPQLLPLYAVFRPAGPALGLQPLPVGTRQANVWGLYDMHGNVAEWCQDWYSPAYSPGPLVDPTGPNFGPNRVYRGGSYLRSALDCRCAVRFSAPVNFCHQGIGIRLARTLKAAQGDTPLTPQGGDLNQR